MGIFAASNKPNAKGEITIYLVYYVNDEGVPRSGHTCQFCWLG